MNFFRNCKTTLLAAGVWAFGIASASAHDPGLSALRVMVQGDRTSVEMTLARADVDSLLQTLSPAASLSRANFDSARPALAQLAGAALSVKSSGGLKSLKAVNIAWGESDTVYFKFEGPMMVGDTFEVSSSWLAQLPRGHRQHATVSNAKGLVVAEAILDAQHHTLRATASPAHDEGSVALQPSAATGQEVGGNGSVIVRFFALGIEHILIGYDHLVFLLGLLIVGGTWRDTLKIITSFTVAHSLTLCLVTLGLVRIPSSIVEVLIAASIIYVGVENIVRRKTDWRWLLAFGFGLIHGCGFASVLQELGIGSQGVGVVWPLLMFNLGVEIGQVAVTAVVLPIIWALKHRPHFELRYVPACSVVIALAGLVWLVDRVYPR